MKEIHYTITSRNHNDYSIIKENLISPQTAKIEFMVTNLTTTCSFIVLDSDDYIVFCGRKIYMFPLSDANKNRVIDFLNIRLAQLVKISFHNLTDKLVMHRDGEKFTVNDMSYNLKLLTGFYNDTFPIESDTSFYLEFLNPGIEKPIKFTTHDFLSIDDDKKFLPYDVEAKNERDIVDALRLLIPNYISMTFYPNENRFRFNTNREFKLSEMSPSLIKFFKVSSKDFPKKSNSHEYITASSSCYFHSTPILYLISNLGTTHHSYVDGDPSNRKILMKINNTFMYGFPIVCHNFEYSSTVNSSAMSSAWFQLVDANFRPIKLTTPIYISAIAVAINDYTPSFK